jgi:hypothetical protein
MPAIHAGMTVISIVTLSVGKRKFINHFMVQSYATLYSRAQLSQRSFFREALGISTAIK